MNAHEKVHELLFERDDVTWQTVLLELVRSEEMNPWDIDISLISKKYLEMVRNMKELNLRLSGKVVLAAALLLRLKSDHLLTKGIDELDKLFAMTEEADDDLLFEEPVPGQPDETIPPLLPRTPQPRKRKVSVYDLIDALNRALEVKRRNVVRSIPPAAIEIPEKKRDVSAVIKELYTKIKDFFTTGKKGLTFSTLVPSDNKEEKVLTLIPLLHLTNQRKIDLNQEEHFGEIEILLRTKQAVDKELGVT